MSQSFRLLQNRFVRAVMLSDDSDIPKQRWQGTVFGIIRTINRGNA